MRKLDIVRLLVGIVASGLCLWAAAHLTGGTGGHGATQAAPWVLGAVIGASLLHLPAHVLMSLIDMAAVGMEGRLSAMSHADRPSMNEDVFRSARLAALGGLKVSLNRFWGSALANRHEHDLKQVEAFRDELAAWISEEMKATRRQDRPANGGWTQAGLGYDGVIRPKGTPNPVAPGRTIEEIAWDEVVVAMGQRNMVVPKAFAPFFRGERNCGLGWRWAGHLMFVEDLKRNRNAFVGFIIESLSRLEDQVRETNGGGGVWDFGPPGPAKVSEDA